VSPPASSSSEPAFSLAGHDSPGGTAASGLALTRLADRVIAILGSAPLALLLGGSHATAEAVWFEHDGRRVTLSDVDLWAVFPDETSRRGAARRLAAAAVALARETAALGFLAPVEVTLLTPASLAALPARPASLELAARGRALAGDPAWLARLPRHTAGDVSHEETLLLLENRAFELLGACPAPNPPETTRVLSARHAVLKTALDLAAVLALDSGELPIGATARARWGREQLARDPRLEALVTAGLPELWDLALAWRAGRVQALVSQDAVGEWHRVVTAWVAVWRHVTRAGAADPYAHAVRFAARASWPRRVRRSLFPAVADAPPFARRWRAAPRGTPQHRLNASATILLIAAAAAVGEPALDAGVTGALRLLDVAPGCLSWRECARLLLTRWNDWVLGGRRVETA
jgi:hypothetical protein